MIRLALVRDSTTFAKDVLLAAASLRLPLERTVTACADGDIGVSAGSADQAIDGRAHRSAPKVRVTPGLYRGEWEK